jgi:hypothetical protein
MKRAVGCFVVLSSVMLLAVVLNVKQVWGAVYWSKNYGGTNYEECYGLVRTSDGGYALAGYAITSNGGFDFWLVKTDANGNEQWTKSYDYGDQNMDVAWDLVQTSDGGYALAGYTLDSYLYPNDANFLLVKTDENGNMEWNRTLYDLKAFALVQTSDGGYALAGVAASAFQLVKTDMHGEWQWGRDYSLGGESCAYALVQTSDGGYALAGYTKTYGAGQDFWLVKTDANGNAQWNMTYSGGADDVAWDLVQTSDGGYALAGYTESYGVGGTDFWLVKTDGSGNAQWRRSYGGTLDEWAYALVQADDGGYALAGYTASFGAGDLDFWLVKTDASGNALENRTFGGVDNDIGWDLVQTSDNGYALAGSTTSFSVGYTDFWLVKTGVMIPEFPSNLALGALFVTSIFIVILTKRRIPRVSLE